MSYTLFAVTALNAEEGKTEILAAAADENIVRTELLPEFTNMLAATVPMAKTAEDRTQIITVLQSLAVVKLEATEVPL